MQNRVSFEYAIIRVVPKVEREEFFNVGVVLFSKRKRFLDIKYQIDAKKLNAFSEDLDMELVENYLAGWQKVCEGKGAIGQLELPDRFRWLAACRSTIIQSSKTHIGLTDNPQKELEDIFEKYVL